MPSCGDYVLHFLTLFWKILFAFVPPTGLCPFWPFHDHVFQVFFSWLIFFSRTDKAVSSIVTNAAVQAFEILFSAGVAPIFLVIDFCFVFSKNVFVMNERKKKIVLSC